MIVAENISKFYSGHRAIDDVSFSIKDGEIVGLLGLNGAGKSTILKILGCFLMPSGGRASVAGFSVESEPHEIRRRIGYLPDSPPLYEEMTVVSYLKYVARLKDVAPSQIVSRVDDAIDKTNLKEVAASHLGSLSHGFRQRVGIAQALVHAPKVLILDEPINGLDPVQIVEMRDLILSLRGQHTVILSSHILSEITRTCDRVMIIDDGRLIAEGAESQLQDSVSRAVHLECQVEAATAGLKESIAAVPGVAKVEVAGLELKIEADASARPAIAKAIVEAGAGLLSMSKAEAGLEGVFMKLIRGAEGK